MALADTRCSLHATAEETGPSGRTVVALRPGERLDRDFILRLAVADRADMGASLLLTPDAGQDPVEGTFLLTVLPPIGQGAARPRDVALVLDRSGSMSGWKMVAARRAAARIVDTLTTADRLAVFCFDNVVERPPGLPDGLAEATDRNRFRAVEFLSQTAARGGTEMLDPLDRAVGLLAGTTEPETATAGPAGSVAASGRERVLVLITDGQVGNEDQILRHLGSQLTGIRVHAVGIDQAVNAGFLGRLATVGGGRCELVESEDRLDAAAARIHRRIGAPLAAGLTLSGDGFQIVPDTVAPSRLPDLFPGVPLTVAGRWRGQPGGTITVRGTCPDGQPFEAKAVAVTGGSPASRALWARAHLRDLEDRYASLDPSGPAELALLEQQITSVSLGHGVLCRFTAFVATDTRVVIDGGTPHRVTQPVEFPSGWDPAAFGFPPGPRHRGPMPPTREPARRLTPMLQAAAGGQDPVAPTAAQWTRTARPGAWAAMAAPSARPQGRTVFQADDAHRLALARHQAADEAAALRTARGEPGNERRRLLADLASRLDALIASLADAPSLWQQRAALAGLASKLRDCDQPPTRSGAELDALWDETIALLTSFGKGRLPADNAPRPLTHPFWKRQA
jgi:Ca-activated chloride channel family protein